jgi:hypothetical protein
MKTFYLIILCISSVAFNVLSEAEVPSGLLAIWFSSNIELTIERNSIYNSLSKPEQEKFSSIYTGNLFKIERSSIFVKKYDQIYKYSYSVLSSSENMLVIEVDHKDLGLNTWVIFHNQEINMIAISAPNHFKFGNALVVNEYYTRS